MADNENNLTVEEFREKYEPLLNVAADLIITHPDIPETVDQSETLSAIKLLQTELEQTLEGRVSAINELEDKIARQEKQIRKLQETNQQLFLKVGTKADPKPDPKPPKKSFAEISAIINNLPG